MKKKLKRIVLRTLCCIAAFVFCVYIGIGLFGGYHVKGIACQGGFIHSFWQQQTENGNIQRVCSEELSKEQLMEIKNNLQIDRDKDRIMHTKYTSSDGEEVLLQCKIVWFWNDVYEWTVVSDS